HLSRYACERPLQAGQIVVKPLSRPRRLCVDDKPERLCLGYHRVEPGSAVLQHIDERSAFGVERFKRDAQPLLLGPGVLYDLCQIAKDVDLIARGAGSIRDGNIVLLEDALQLAAALYRLSRPAREP